MVHKLMAGTMIAAVIHVSAAHAADDPAALHRVKAGYQIYQQYCAACHGANAEGAPDWQQRDENGEMPAPPHNAEGHTWRHSDAMLYNMISNGLGDPFNKTKRLTMPAFADVLSPERVRAVIDYLKTLWTPEQRQFQAEESRGGPPPKP